MDLRCGPRLHARLDVKAAVLEFKCDSVRCGARKGEVVVLHYFSSTTGEFIKTLRFKHPASHRRKELNSASRGDSAVRTA